MPTHFEGDFLHIFWLFNDRFLTKAEMQRGEVCGP